MENNPNTVFKKIVLNPKCPQHSRIAALKFLPDPSFALLRRIVEDPESPGRLAALAAQLFARKVARKQVEAENAKANRKPDSPGSGSTET